MLIGCHARVASVQASCCTCAALRATLALCALQAIDRIVKDFSSAASDASHPIADTDVGPRLMRPLACLSISPLAPTMAAPVCTVAASLMPQWLRAAQIAVTLIIRALTPVGSSTLAAHASSNPSSLSTTLWARFALLCTVIADASSPLGGGSALLATAAARCAALLTVGGGPECKQLEVLVRLAHAALQTALATSCFKLGPNVF